MEQNNMIKFQDVSVVFPDKKREIAAVRNVSFDIHQGEIFGIVGASGAGKSTLLRTVNLLQPPTGGQVFVNGENITTLRGNALRRLRSNAGMIFQQFNLINTKTVYDNIAFVMKVVGKSHSEIARRVPETLEMVGLSDRANSYPAHLSGGEKQRVGIARALANNPLILLCDEPTSALDLENTNAILRLIKDININTGITTVIISHEMHVIKKICKRVAVMSQGKVIELDEVFNIFTAPKQDFTRQIVSQTLDIDFPAHSTLRTDSKTLKLIYSGERASDAVISDTIVFFNVKINILLGKIEYIADKPYGVLIVEITGSTEQLDASERYLREHTYKVENVEKGTI